MSFPLHVNTLNRIHGRKVIVSWSCSFVAQATSACPDHPADLLKPVFVSENRVDKTTGPERCVPFKPLCLRAFPFDKKKHILRIIFLAFFCKSIKSGKIILEMKGKDSWLFLLFTNRRYPAVFLNFYRVTGNFVVSDRSNLFIQ